MPIIKCTSCNSNSLVSQKGKGSLKEAQIAHRVKTDKLSKKLFCFVGTSILLHNYIEGHQDPKNRPSVPKEKLQHNLKYGATKVLSGETWLFAGDFVHCDAEDLKHNVRRLKSMLQKYIRIMPKSKPFALHKDYDDGCHLCVTKLVKKEVDQVTEGIKVWETDRKEWFEQESRFSEFHDLKTLKNFVSPPNSYLERNKREFEEKMKQHKEIGCPICANREYLEGLGNLVPDVTGDKDIDYRLSMNLNYYRAEDSWALNWLILYNKFALEHTPKCKKCKRPIRTGVIFGCGSWVDRVKSKLCDEHDLNYQKKMAALNSLYFKQPQKRKKTIKDMRYPYDSNQPSLITFMKKETVR